MAAAYAREVRTRASRAIARAGHRAPRLRRLLRERRAAAPARAARPAGRRRRQRAAGGGHHRQLRGAARSACTRRCRPSRARRLCPQAVFIPPDFEAYREKSREVWDIVRERLDAASSRSASTRPTSTSPALEKPLRALRGWSPRSSERDGHHVSVGRRPIAPGGQDGQRRREAARASSSLSREQACERFAGEPPRLLPGVGPRPPSAWPSSASRTRRRPAGAPTPRSCVARFGERMGRWLKARAFFHDASPVRGARARPSRRPARRRSTRTSTTARELEATLGGWPPSVCGGLQRTRRARAHDRDQGPPRRLDHRHPRAHAGGVRPTTPAASPRRARPAARLRAAAAGAPARRARRVLRGRGRRAARRRRRLSSRWRCEARRRRRGGGLGRLSPCGDVWIFVSASASGASLSVASASAAVERVAQLVGVVFACGRGACGRRPRRWRPHAGDAREADELPGHPHGCVGYRP